MNVVHRFWNSRPSNSLSVHQYIKEFDKRLQDFAEHSFLLPGLDDQIKLLLLYHNSINPAKSRASQKSSVTCNYCKNVGHKEDECRKKKRVYNQKSAKTDNFSKNVLSIKDSQDDSGYQLDTAAEFHASGNKSDFSSNSGISQTVQVAGGNIVTAVGRGDPIFPSSNGKLEVLKGAIHIPGQIHRIISTAQIDKPGFSIHWPSNYGNIEPVHPNGTVCATFRRISGRLICMPSRPITKQFNVLSIKRERHSILGHPGQKAQSAVLKSANVTAYKSSSECEICTKCKITKLKGHGSFRSATSFGEVIYMDSDGGQKSLLPTTTDKSVPDATWFLLAVDKFTAWK
ncbi:hypothetical protein K3495_g14017 [Podosphaera aphanis]|nr:hypothetical protein K3495_g14017 [Podosphaera aphanis]